MNFRETLNLSLVQLAFDSRGVWHAAGHEVRAAAVPGVPGLSGEIPRVRISLDPLGSQLLDTVLLLGHWLYLTVLRHRPRPFPKEPRETHSPGSRGQKFFWVRRLRPG